MSPTTLLISALFLCGLEETVLSQRGKCAGNQCFAVFQKPADYPGAQRGCKASGGQMLRGEHAGKILSIAPSGSYWLELGSTNRSAAEEALQNCFFVFVSADGHLKMLARSCRDTLNGYLCQYTINEPCSGLQIGGSAQVNYTTPMNFEVYNSVTFPPGTIAVTGTGKYPDSKHVCSRSGWLQAPWNCEVMQGGCGHTCNSTTGTCSCPAWNALHPNNIDCTGGPCESNPCTGEGEQCEPIKGGFKCTCKDDFEEEEGVCVDLSVCDNCEHMLCDKVNGVYQCQCRKGFKVSDHNPSKCDMICTERDCPSRCVKTNEGVHDCFCPDGYIKDFHPANGSMPFCTDIDECEADPCDHKCENVFGSFRCLCDEGFKLQPDGYSCVPEEDGDDGSGSTPPYPTPGVAHPAAAVPSYIKTGSILGITVFMALCAALLFFLIRNAVKRCGKFELSTFKHPDLDIFYLQQVTTETYKRLSFDKQIKNDS